MLKEFLESSFVFRKIEIGSDMYPEIHCTRAWYSDKIIRGVGMGEVLHKDHDTVKDIANFILRILDTEYDRRVLYMMRGGFPLMIDIQTKLVEILNETEWIV